MSGPMPGGGMPSPEYLAQINASAMPSAPPNQSPVPIGPPAAPPTVPYGAGAAPSSYFDAPPSAPSGWAGPDPIALFAAGLASAAPPPPAPAPPQGGAAPQGPSRPFLQQVGAAGVANMPAKETELRGPHLQAAQQGRNAAFEGAVQAVTERSQRTAAGDMAIALDQERKAGIREDAANYTAAQRNDEMQERQEDFDASVRALSQTSVDPGRFWANQTTGTKLAALISATLGGFVSMHNGGRNVGLEQINTMVNNDIKAQEFAFTVNQGTANAKQTAFSMAMQKYNNIDAARAAARAASLDAAQAQIAQQAALWKGTEAANRGEMAIAALQDEKMTQIAQGIMFTPARQVAVGASYIDPRTGLRYSEQEAKGLVGKMDEREFEREKIGLNTAGAIATDQAKSATENGAGGLGKAGRQTIALEAQKAQLELDANLKSINAAKSDVKAIAAGGKVGNYWSHNPAWMPGATGAKQDANTREAYNRRVMMAVAASFKLSTDASEPKRKEMLEHFAEPFIVMPDDNEEMVLTRMNALSKQLEDSAASRGAEAPALPASLKFHGGK